MSTWQRHAGRLYKGEVTAKKNIDHRQNTKLFFGLYQFIFDYYNVWEKSQ